MPADSRTPPRPLAARALTALGRAIPKRDGAIVCHSAIAVEDGTLALLTELVRRGYRPTLLAEERLSAAARSLLPAGVRVLAKDTWRGRWAYLRARNAFSTHDAYRPHDPPSNQVLFNIWHGEPVGKIGLRWTGDQPPGATMTTASSNLGRPFRIVEFGLPPDRVLTLGSPRNDRLLRADRERVSRRVSGDSDGPLIIWMPTYRVATGVRTDGEPFDGAIPLDAAGIDELDRRLGALGARALIVPHPHEAATSELAGRERIEAITNEWLFERGVTLYEALAVADLLITDVSSVWADFLLTGRPIVFHFPDLEAYRASRGLHLEPLEHWLPGPLTTDGGELYAAIEEALGPDEFAGERQRLAALMHTHRDGRSAERILDASGLPSRPVSAGSDQLAAPTRT